MSTHPGYPKNLDDKSAAFSHGGVRIYPVTAQLADEFAEQFPKSFKYDPPYLAPAGSEQLLYMNVNHGEQHFIFSLPLK